MLIKINCYRRKKLWNIIFHFLLYLRHSSKKQTFNVSKIQFGFSRQCKGFPDQRWIIDGRMSPLRQFGRRQCLTTVARVGVRSYAKHTFIHKAWSQWPCFLFFGLQVSFVVVGLLFSWPMVLLLVCCLVKRGLARFEHQMLHPWSDRRLPKKKKTDRDG